MMANKTDAGNGSEAICRVSNVLRSPSPDPKRSHYQQVMRAILLALSAVSLFTGCSKHEEPRPIFAGRVEYFYFLDSNDVVAGVTRFDQGRPGTKTSLKEDVFLEVYKDWVVMKLLNRKSSTQIIPRERVREIIVGTKEGNELNIP